MERVLFKIYLLHRRLLLLQMIRFRLIFLRLSTFHSIFFIPRNPWLMDVLKSCLQRNPAKRPPIGGSGGLLQHPFLQPQGERAMQLFQAATLGNENMQDVVRQILHYQDDSIWKKEDCCDVICKVCFYFCIFDCLGIC